MFFTFRLIKHRSEIGKIKSPLSTFISLKDVQCQMMYTIFINIDLNNFEKAGLVHTNIFQCFHMQENEPNEVF